MATMEASAESASEDVERWGYWRSRLVFNPWLWLGLANVALLSAAVVAMLRQRYPADWRGIEGSLPDPRWIGALALMGLVLVVVKPGKWAAVGPLVAVASGLAIFVDAVSKRVVYVLPPTGRRTEPLLMDPQGWQDWVDTPMRAEGIAAAIFVAVALAGFVVAHIICRGRSARLGADGRWWVAAGSFSILVVAAVALLRLWRTQDIMDRELGSAGFACLALVALAAFLVAVVVLEQEAAWVAVITLGVAAAMGWGPALGWADQTKEWPGPALVHQSMVAEGLTAFVLGGVAVLVAVVWQVRDRLALAKS